MEREVILLRHGLTQANVGQQYCGFTDVPLSEEGVARLEALRQSFAYPDSGRYRVITSGLRRAEQTLAVLYGEVPHRAEPDFREMNFGEFEMLSYEDAKDRADFLKWVTEQRTECPCTGGESADEMSARVWKRLRRLLAEGTDNLLIVAHGGPISFLMLRLFPGERTCWHEWQPEGGRGYRLIFEGEQAIRYTHVPVERTE